MRCGAMRCDASNAMVAGAVTSVIMSVGGSQLAVLLGISSIGALSVEKEDKRWCCLHSVSCESLAALVVRHGPP